MDFNERNPLSVSSLAAAVELNDVAALQRLLDKGRNPNITDNRGWTPLHEAAKKGHLKCVSILLKKGARIDVKTHEGETPFFIACKFNKVEVLQKLFNLNKRLVHISDNESVTPLHLVVMNRHPSLIKLFLKNGANINAEDNYGFTPLLEAVRMNDIELSKLLLELGSNINAREYYGHLAFHFASMSGTLEMLKMLISYYTERGNLSDVIDVTTSGGQTPLMLAIQNDALDAVRELLRVGANAEIPSEKNRLPLHMAAHFGKLDMLRLVRNATSSRIINKYCTVPTNALVSDLLQNSLEPTTEVSLVSLVLDSANIDCLQYILDCGLNCDVLNCPILYEAVLPIIYDEVRNFQAFGPHTNIQVEVNLEDLEVHTINRVKVFVLHPLVFLLKDKLLEFRAQTQVYLYTMLQNGLSFSLPNIQQEGVLILHPYDAIFLNWEYFTTPEWKSIVISCLMLLFENGISVDYGIENATEGMPILFVYACRLPLLELIPYLLIHSKFVDIDDLLRWLVHKLFLRIDPPPHVIDQPLFQAYNYLIKYTCKSYRNYLEEVRVPGYESRFNYVLSFLDSTCTHNVASMQLMCRSVIRKSIKDSCQSSPYQLNFRINELELPASMISFLNYNEMINHV